MSLNVVIATTGRPTLTRMLESIIPDLDPEDYITLLVDGENRGYFVDQMVREVQDKQERHINIIRHYSGQKMGYWGHAIRNKYKSKLLGDFICHADDDDHYVNNGISVIKSHAAPDSLYLFRFLKYANNTVYKYWAKQGVFKNNVGTPCGVYPNQPDLVPDFGLFYGGDGEFYEKLAMRLKTFWIDKIIYKAI